MPKFITIGYGDRAGYDGTPKEIRDAAHTHEAEMKKRGALIGVAGAPAQVRNPLAAGVTTENSVSQTPCAVAHGVVEVWPLEQA